MKRVLIIKEASFSYFVKKSKFFGYVFPICSRDEFTQKMDTLKKTYPCATHYCYAYRIQNEVGALLERMTDDGEPHGTVGIPYLSLLQKQSIANGAIVAIRFFGGIKLGKKALLSAYLHTATEALKEVKLELFIPLEKMNLTVEYGVYEILQNENKAFSIQLIQISYGQSIDLEITIQRDQKETYIKMLQNTNLANHVIIH